MSIQYLLQAAISTMEKIEMVCDFVNCQNGILLWTKRKEYIVDSELSLSFENLKLRAISELNWLSWPKDNLNHIDDSETDSSALN